MNVGDTLFFYFLQLKEETTLLHIINPSKMQGRDFISFLSLNNSTNSLDVNEINSLFSFDNSHINLPSVDNLSMFVFIFLIVSMHTELVMVVEIELIICNYFVCFYFDFSLLDLESLTKVF